MLPAKTWEHLLKALSTTPSVVSRLIEPFPKGHRAWDKSVPGRFTSREHIAHLADWDEVFLERARMSVEEHEPIVPNPDETQLSIDRAHAESDPFESARRFADRRSALVAFLSDLNEEDRLRVGVHPSHGPMTVEAQAVHVLGHDGYHLAYLTEHLTD